MAKLRKQPLPLQITDLGIMIERYWAAALAPYNISPGEYRILAILVERGPLTAVEIIPHVSLEQSLISRTVQRLFEKRLVTRRRSRTDRRSVTLRITPEGEALERQALASLDQLAEALVAGLSASQREQTAKTLTVMSENIERLMQSP